MDLSIISTYRCDSRCSMCFIWKNPTLPEEEVRTQTLEKLPLGFVNLNITGGEPTLRKDLIDIIDIVVPKAQIVEISTNGLHADKLEPIIKKYPNIKIRFSLEGFGELNNIIRGEIDGCNIKIKGLRRLRELGGTDLGFATVIQDDNIHQLVELYQFASHEGFELSTSALHNAFQFHKNDNFPYSRSKVAKEVELLVVEMLKSYSIKNWFRAYLNLGLIKKILGQDRLIPCTATTDFIFIDPWSDVYACNVRPDLLMGNLEGQEWVEIVQNERSKEIREKVALCKQNCWMVTTARTAMRNRYIPQIPKFNPLLWVIENKLKLIAGKTICFDKEVDYSDVLIQSDIQKRVSYLHLPTKRQVQRKTDAHYNQGQFYNR